MKFDPFFFSLFFLVNKFQTCFKSFGTYTKSTGTRSYQIFLDSFPSSYQVNYLIIIVKIILSGYAGHITNIYYK